MPAELSRLVLSGSDEEEPGAFRARRLPIRLFVTLFAHVASAAGDSGRITGNSSMIR
jgi:hypothetical protein